MHPLCLFRTNISTMTETFQIPEGNFFEVIVIGGGPCGLAICSRLCEETPGAIFSDGEHQRFHWLKKRGNLTNVLQKKSRALSNTKLFSPDDILVLDKVNEKFMGQWENQFDAVKIPHLRSPMFFHPDPSDIDALTAFAYSQGREDELMEIHGVVGQEITKHRQKKMRNKRKLSDSHTKKDQLPHHLVEVDRRNWQDYYRPGTKLFWDFCEMIVKKYDLENVVKKAEVVDIKYGEVNKIMNNGEVETGMGFQIETSVGDIFGCKVAISAIGNSGRVNYPLKPELDNMFPLGSCHTSHLFQKIVQLPPDHISQKIKDKQHSEIAIVGGGLTSAQLTELALKKGINKIHYITRSEIKIKHFDFHLEWVSKFQNVMKSSFWMKDTDEERFNMINSAREGGSVNPQYHKVLMDLIKKGKVIHHKHCEIVDKTWDDGKWSEITLMNNADKKTSTLKNIDYIVYATGNTPNITLLPMMKNIVRDHPIDLINGIPCLTDELQWNDEIPLFMIGCFAMLKIGPSSLNLDGGRLGAERVGWEVQHLKRIGKLNYEKSVALDGKVYDRETNPNLQLTGGFESLLRCTSGRVNWYTFLDDALA